MLAVKDVGHEGPEEGHDEEIEDTHPNVEGASDPDILCRRQGAHKQVENDQVHAEKSVGDGEKSPSRHPRDDGGEESVGDQHRDQRAGEHPREVFNPARRCDVIADRPDDVVAAENDEVEQAGKEERAYLVGADIDRLAQERDE